MPTWPSTVNQRALAGTYISKRQTNFAEFKPEVGQPKRRKRSSISCFEKSWESLLTAAELEYLNAWFEDDLEDGSLEFTAIEPSTQQTETFIFREPYEVAHVAPNIFRVRYNLLQLP